MIHWSQFIAGTPELASFGQQRLESRIAYLATIRPDGSPRVHPVSPFIAGDYLFVYMEPTSPKGDDLRRDARYAVHCGVEDNTGGQGEFFISGRAAEVSDTKSREEAFEQARFKGYNPKERYILFELKIEEAMGTVYEEGQPKRTRWKGEQIDGGIDGTKA
jgi:pyridoxamine 5'-phosphate oxidase-like protein